MHFSVNGNFPHYADTFYNYKFSLGVWYDLKVVYDSTAKTAKMWVNGNFEQEDTFDTAQIFRIRAGHFGCKYYNLYL